VSHERNKYDAHTLPEVLEQIKEPSGTEPAPWNTNIYSTGPAVAICDRGYRGVSKVGNTQILIPKKPKKDAPVYRKRKARKRFRKRAGIEAIIGHLKSDFRLIRNYLKGSIGDSINLMLAAAAFNFKKWMRKVAGFLFVLFVLVLNKQHERQLGLAGS